jgi:hypothetical protein
MLGRAGHRKDRRAAGPCQSCADAIGAIVVVAISATETAMAILRVAVFMAVLLRENMSPMLMISRLI